MVFRKSLTVLFLVIYISNKNGDAAKAGTFFWKPSLGLDLTVPTTLPPPEFSEATRGNIQEGVVVLINGYEAGMTIMAMVSGATNSEIYHTMNPMSAYFYTNAYRWALRHFSSLPQWLGGSKTFYQSTEVWKRRFYFLDTFIPKFMRKAFPYVKEEEWNKEEREMYFFKKYAEAAFGKGYRYPNKKFNNFKSWETEESVDNLDLSSFSTEEIVVG